MATHCEDSKVASRFPASHVKPLLNLCVKWVDVDASVFSNLNSWAPNRHMVLLRVFFKLQGAHSERFKMNLTWFFLRMCVCWDKNDSPDSTTTR